MSSVITRRDFARTVGLAVAATSVATSTSAPASAAPGRHTSFASLKQVDAGPSEGRLRRGRSAGRSARDPAARLALRHPQLCRRGADTRRAWIPRARAVSAWLRQHAFRSADTVRNGQQAALATDVIAFMDALEIDRAVIGGFDWGARTADIVAAVWPERIKALVSVSGYLIVNLVANQRPLARRPSTDGGISTTSPPTRCRRIPREHPRLQQADLAEGLAPWKFDDATYDRTAAAFTNPDHVDIVIHNYRWRLSLAPGEPQYDDLDRKLAANPPISVPTITIGSDFDGPNKDGATYREMFTGRVLAPSSRRHRAQRAAGGPQAFADAIIAVDGY